MCVSNHQGSKIVLPVQEYGVLFQDERKLWRCGGRFKNADLPYSAKQID